MAFTITFYPVCGSVDITPSTTYEDENLVAFSDPVYFLRLSEKAGVDVNVQLNGISTARFELPANGVISFPLNAFEIGSIDFEAVSDEDTATVEYICGASKN